jgi:transposase InsO family protein
VPERSDKYPWDAINRYQLNTNQLMFHSDQGTQYSYKAFIEYCNKNSITQSISRKGNCWDNAAMERFFKSLKTERLNHQSFANHYEVVQNVESYIYFYNYKRIHSAIGYMTPAFGCRGWLNWKKWLEMCPSLTGHYSLSDHYTCAKFSYPVDM